MTNKRHQDLLKQLISGILVIFVLTFGDSAVRASAEEKPRAHAARISGDSLKTRFVTDVSKAVGYNVYVLPKPYRVMIDLPEIEFVLPEGSGKNGKGLVSEFRYGTIEAGRSRIVLQTTDPVLIEKSFVLPAEDGNPARIVVDLVKTDTKTFGRLHKLQTPNPPPPPARPNKLQEAKLNDTAASMKEIDAEVPITTGSVPANPVLKDQSIADLIGDPIPLPRVKPERGPVKKQEKTSTEAKSIKPVVVIDPGHGGQDPGAISRRRKTKEKHIVLKFSLLLANLLRESGRYEVYLTRETDRFLTLRDRVKFARDRDADLFIAVHADSLRRGSARGATVYTLSEKASDQEAEALANQENRADVINGVDLGTENDEVAGILIELAQRETKNHSVAFAKNVANHLKKVTRLHRHPLRSAGFRVLKAPDVPSILLELGYLSSRADERKLLSSKWRKKVAASLKNAVDRYFAPRFAAKQ